MIFLGAIALTGISAGIALVIVSSLNPPALVRSDYYADGLRLDEHRAREKVFDSLGLMLTLREESGALVLEAGGAGAGHPSAGERLATLDLVLQLRRPDDPSADRDVPLTFASDSPLLWVADTPPLRRGRWDVRGVFSEGGVVVMENGFAYDAK
jgi:hypothetical protein